MTLEAYSRKLPRISSATSMSTMFSSKSSGGAVVPPRRAAIPNILPCPPGLPGQARPTSGRRKAAVYVQRLTGHVVAGPRGQEHRHPGEVGGLPVAPHHGPRFHDRKSVVQGKRVDL